MAGSIFDANPSTFHLGGLSEREQVGEDTSTFFYYLLFSSDCSASCDFLTGDRLLRAGNCGAKILRQTQAGEEDNAGNNNASETLL